MRKETQPPRRFTEASLLGAMETAGKDIEDAELREAMKDSGIGTPATRASIIERLIDVGYIEREGRALRATEKGIQVIRLLGEHQLTSPELTGDWERRLGLIEQGEDTPPGVHGRHREVHRPRPSQELDKLKGVQIERAKLGPCPVCGREIIENRKGYSCWSRDDPGCGFVIWKKKAGQDPAGVGREGADRVAARSRERGEDPGVGRTEKPSPASAAAPAAPSAPSCSSSRPTRASGASSSTRSGRRSPPPASPRRSARSAEAERPSAAAAARGRGEPARGPSGRGAPAASCADRLATH